MVAGLGEAARDVREPRGISATCARDGAARREMVEVREAGHVGGRDELGAGRRAGGRRDRVPIMPDTADSATANTPPKPQHSSRAWARPARSRRAREQLARGVTVLLRPRSLPVAEPQLAQAVAARMQPDPVRIAARDPLDAEHLDRELAELAHVAERSGARIARAQSA
jgi:hypothetical protein